MKRVINTILFSSAILFMQSCLMTLTTRDGKKWKYKKPISIGTSSHGLDTSRFFVQRFNIANYSHKLSHQNGKRIIELINPGDLDTLLATDATYYVHFYLPGCSATRPHIRKLDSLTRTGKEVIVIALSQSCNTVDRLLSKTNFALRPYYIINPKLFAVSDVLRQINFIKKACSSCYEQYKDEVMDADYLVLQNKTIRVVMYDEPKGQNFLRD